LSTTQITLGYPSATNIFQETALGNTALVVKASAGTVYYLSVDNTLNGSPVYLKIYDTGAAVVVGTTVPDDVIKIPSSIKLPIPIPGGKAYSAGIQVACVTAGGTAGITAPTSSVIAQVVYA